MRRIMLLPGLSPTTAAVTTAAMRVVRVFKSARLALTKVCQDFVCRTLHHGPMFLRDGRWAEVFRNGRALFAMRVTILIKDRFKFGLEDVFSSKAILQEVLFEQVFGFRITADMPDSLLRLSRHVEYFDMDRLQFLNQF